MLMLPLTWLARRVGQPRHGLPAARALAAAGIAALIAFALAAGQASTAPPAPRVTPTRLTAAAAAGQPGQTVIVAPGFYFGQVTIIGSR